MYVYYSTIKWDDCETYFGMFAVTCNIIRYGTNSSDCDWLIPGTELC